MLSEVPGIAAADTPTGLLFTRGRAKGARLLQIDGANDSPQTITGLADNGAVAVRPIDRDAQEDAREVTWSGHARGTLLVANPRATDLSRAGPLALSITVRIDETPVAPVALELKCGPGCSARLDVTARLTAIAGAGWTTLVVPLQCLPGADLSRVTAPFALSTGGRMRLSLSSVALVPSKGSPACS